MSNYFRTQRSWRSEAHSDWSDPLPRSTPYQIRRARARRVGTALTLVIVLLVFAGLAVWG